MFEWKEKASLMDIVPDIIVGQIVLGEGDVGSNYHPHPASHDKVLVEDDAGGHHQPSIGEEPGVVNIEDFT